MIAMNFRVTGVGTVPLTLKLGRPRLVSAFFAAAGPTMPRWFRNTAIVAFILYVFAKLLLSAHRLGPGQLHRFVNEFKQFKTCEYEARIGRKNLDLDLSKIFRAMVLNSKRIPEIVKAVSDALNKKD